MKFNKKSAMITDKILKGEYKCVFTQSTMDQVALNNAELYECYKNNGKKEFVFEVPVTLVPNSK